MSQTLEGRKLIVVFEDTKENMDELTQKLNEIIDDGVVSIVPFPDSESIRENIPEGSRFKDVVEIFLTNNNEGTVEMVIIDLDLTQYTTIDINEPLISDICHKHGIPICVYSKYVMGEDIATHLQNWSEGKITINRNDTFDKIAFQSAIIYRGFQIIKSELEKGELISPIETLAKIMNAPLGADSQIALYASGYQSMIGSLIEKQVPMASMLGYWLHNYILRFPGVLLNEIATASYLNIDVASFKNRDEINNSFDKAKYEGPFHELGPYWWKDSLDDLLAEVEMSDDKEITGLSYLKSKKITDVPHVKCIEGGHDGAGFYCFLLHQPVCSKHSKGDISWLPAGAILSRISVSKWDELGPWFGF